ncbi:hypothetical protein NEOLEDRAFT_1136667 [Neolentinus lepideus HHB14362 ss-1]|uniref:Uncharacterized protein n=1 Tax=Neolentinus lepideus HHB14362 ss-1 TaxID=1314782 RepID=A0A165R568_9AGAM|nr:hypothetical protein NEOLEDRAFT_1136667 [Neolentinus lepideus HHB14362 ss-1]
MLAPFPSPVLALAPDVLKDLEGREALSGLWTLFTKCKESLQDGRRLENISWRLWYAELATSQSSSPSTPSSVASSRTSSHLTVFTDVNEKDVPQAALSLTPIPSPTPSSPTGRHRTPSPHLPSSVVSSSHLSVTDIPPTRVRRSSSSVGKIICDLLPEKLVVPHTHIPQRTPSVDDALPPSKTTQRPTHAQRAHNAAAAAPLLSISTTVVPAIKTSAPPAASEVSPPSTITTAASTPQPSGLFPRVVIVNPTPHPTPPATPQMPANCAPFLVPTTSTTLLPPAHPLAKPVNPSQLKSPAVTPSPEPPKLKASDENIKTSDRCRFFLHQSESPDKDSPERPSPSPSSEQTVFEDLDEGDVIDVGSVMSHSSATSDLSTRSKQSNARESATSKRTATNAKSKKGKEVARHAQQRPPLHRMHTAGGARTGHLTAAKRSQSTANVHHAFGMERTKSAGAGAAKPAAVERTKSAGAGPKVKSPSATSARSEEAADGKEKGAVVAEEAVRNSPMKSRAMFKVGSSSSNGTDSVNGNASPVKQLHVLSGVQQGAASDGKSCDADSAAKSGGAPLVPRRDPLSLSQPQVQSASQSKSTGQLAPAVQTQPRRQPSAQPKAKAQATAQGQTSISAKQSSSSKQQQQHPASQRRGIIVTSSEYETTDTEGEDDDSWESEASDRPQAQAQNHRYVDQNKRTAAISAATREQIRIQEAALEAQRQREMFAKLPKRSYSNLQRTQSGLLSQLLNPNPAIFPPEHPYRRSTDDIAAKARVLSATNMGMTPMNGVGAPKLQTSKSSASVAEAAPVQVQAKVTVPHAGSSRSKQQQDGGGYRPKGMPKAEELEYDTDSDDEDGENGIQVSKSLAQQKLAALAGPQRRTSTGQEQQQQQPPRPPVPSNVANRQLPEKPPAITNRVHTDPSPRRPDRPVLSTVATAPIPLNHPYNLPAPAPPMTPRTTRRQMLATELSESLRRNLLWERQVSKVNIVGRRNNGVLGSGLRPLTSTNMQQASAQGQAQAGGSGQQTQQVNGQQPPKTKEEEKEEKRRQAMARNRSWADDYHYSGW